MDVAIYRKASRGRSGCGNDRKGPQKSCKWRRDFTWPLFIPICAPSAILLRVCGCGWCVRVCQMSFALQSHMTSFDQSADVTAYMTSYLPAWFLWILRRGALGSIWAHVRGLKVWLPLLDFKMILKSKIELGWNNLNENETIFWTIFWTVTRSHCQNLFSGYATNHFIF